MAAAQAKAFDGTATPANAEMDEFFRRLEPLLLAAAKKAGATGAWILIGFFVIAGVISAIVRFMAT